MKLKKVIVTAVLALSASAAFAQEKDNLTSTGGILVKNSDGNCVLVKGNQNLNGCGAAEEVAMEEKPVEAPAEIVTQNFNISADTTFDFNKSNLKPAGKETIMNIARELASKNAQLQGITVVGHTDSKGSDAYNQKLSERRALSVTNFLIENGVPAGLIQAYGEGERNPIADNKTEAGRAANRRVEIVVQATAQQKM